MQNDISFLTENDTFISLSEHQSTLNPNMGLRLPIYYFEILKDYISSYKVNLFSYDVVKVPAPELYVLYNGKAKLKQNKQYIKDNFYVDSGFINSMVNVIDINFNRLSKNNTDKDVFMGYAYFIDKIRSFLDFAFPLEEALEKAKKECYNNGYLLDYIDKKEFLTMALTEYTMEQEMIERAKAAEKRGEKRGKIEIVKEMLKSNIPIDTIVQISKLTLEQLLEIQKEIQKENNK